MGYAFKRYQIVPTMEGYENPIVHHFIKYLMKKGKKGVAKRIFFDTMKSIKSKTKASDAEIFQKAIQNVKPIVEVRSKRIGGATYQVPIEVPLKRAHALAIRWIILYASQRKGRSMAEKLSNEIIAAANNDGGAIKKREETHKMAEANRAFAHYR